MKNKSSIKRFSIILISLLTMIIFLAACGTDNATGAKSSKAVTLNIASIGDWVKDVDRKLAESFTKETGIKIDFQVMAEDQYANVLKTRLAAGEGPDIFFTWGAANAFQFLPDKNFADLSGEPWVKNLDEMAKLGVNYEGKILAWPTGVGQKGWGMMYNTEIFDKLGLKVPKTYEEFIAVCEKLKASGINPIYEPLKDNWHPGLWFAVIGPLANNNTPGLYDKLNSNQAKFADVKEFETYLTQLKQVYDKGYFGKDSLSDTWDKAPDALKSGKYGMFFSFAIWDGYIKEKDPQGDYSKWSMFPVPFAGNNMYAPTVELMRVVNKNSKNLDAAKQYLQFISKEDNLKTYYDARKDVLPGMKPFPSAESEKSKQLTANSNGKFNMSMENGIKFWDNTTEGKYVIDMLLGGKTPKQLLEAFDADRQKLFNANAK